MMSLAQSPTLNITKIPKKWVIALIVICILPYLLNVFGVDFSTSKNLSAPIENVSEIDGMFYKLSGAFSHTLLEWSAFCTALFTVILAFVHFGIKKDLTTPIIGMALFFAGCMDAFHTLAADRLIEAVADNRNLIPFTWAICRLFNALIMIAGVGLLLMNKNERSSGSTKFVIGVSVGFGFAAYSIINYCATSELLPQTMFPESIITRPFDVLPLIVFIIAGLFIYPRFYRARPSLFSHAMLVSVIPQIATQLHMSFGSVALFDNHFNIAHFLKIIAYIVPFLGLLLDYVRTYREEEITIKQLKTTQHALVEQTQLLVHKNKELNDFAYIVSHDLKAPLRAIGSLADWIASDYADKFDADGKEQMGLLKGRVVRMHNLIEGILQYSRIGRINEAKQKVDTAKLVPEVVDSIAPPEEISITVVDKLPEITFEKTRIIQVFQNLIGNAVKYMDKDIGVVKVGCKFEEDYWKFHVADNGPGIDEKYHAKVFQIFQTLNPRDEVESTGVGLSVVKKIVETSGGQIWIESEVGAGSTFYFTIPHKGRE